ncbi:MAG TPA: STAS/SEC14 domain-containing protein [Longimicrobium sp.]|nr:STAS/SEC14 domain-containing protein [Longimicrobium sp.]
MITILDLGPSVVAYRVDGKVERGDIDEAFATMDRALAANASIRAYTEVVDFGGISLDALWEDLRLAIGRWSALSKIDRVAVVTDLEWMKRLSVWEGKLFRGMEVRAFPLARQAEAREWIGS